MRKAGATVTTKARTRCLRRLAATATDSIRANLFTELMIKGYDDDYEPRFFCEPTLHPPGSIGKINEMRDRLMRGEDLHHELDNRTAASIELQMEMCAMMAQGYKHRKRMW